MSDLLDCHLTTKIKKSTQHSNIEVRHEKVKKQDLHCFSVQLSQDWLVLYLDLLFFFLRGWVPDPIFSAQTFSYGQIRLNPKYQSIALIDVIL